MKDFKKNYDLIIFDADGTIIDRESGAYLFDFIGASKSIWSQMVDVAIATNQGGPACSDAGWKTSYKYPNLQFTLDRFAKIENETGAAIYLSLAFSSSAGWIFPTSLPEDDPRLRRSWRKPNPGMLLQAMKDFGVTPDRTLMVGDSPDDEGAAANAGCHFMHIDEFRKETA